MTKDGARLRLAALQTEYEALSTRPNEAAPSSNGIYQRYLRPVLTAGHVPLDWRYDLDPARNPFMMERLGINAVFNAGAIKWNDRYCVVARVEGNDRKSFFAVAESANGVDNFRFWPEPLNLPETDDPDTNVYDMRLTAHADGWVYGLFCTERKDLSQPHDLSAAVAQCGIARTKDLVAWERLPDLKTKSGQQRNVVLHPEFVDGQYALYTRPQDGFITVGSGGGIGWGLCADITRAVIDSETIVDTKVYHTIKELKNGQGPAPLKTTAGWLHLAHGVRNTAAGLRYVLYLFMTDLDQPWQVAHAPGGLFLAPEGEERVGDVSNVAFSNGWIEDGGKVFIYYASSDTRLHVATSTVEQLIDYCLNTPPDPLTSAGSVRQRRELIARNSNYMKRQAAQ